MSLHPGDEALVIGASGAVSGMMAATRALRLLAGRAAGGRPSAAAPIALPAEPLLAVLRNSRALAFILVWFAVNMIFGLAGGLVAGVSGPIAWEAHIGGFLAGLLCFPLLDPVRADDRSSGERLASLTPNS